MAKTKAYNYPDGEDYYRPDLNESRGYNAISNEAETKLFVSSFTKPLFTKHQTPQPIGFSFGTKSKYGKD